MNGLLFINSHRGSRCILQDSIASSPLSVVVSSHRTLQDAFAFAQRLVLLASTMRTASQPTAMDDLSTSPARPRLPSKPTLRTYYVQLSDVEDGEEGHADAVHTDPVDDGSGDN